MGAEARVVSLPALPFLETDFFRGWIASSSFRRCRAATSRNALMKSGRSRGFFRFVFSGKGAAWSADPGFGVNRGRPRLRLGGSGVSAGSAGFGMRAR
jgi:hypothetical protein